jgi:hypothetical protein
MLDQSRLNTVISVFTVTIEPGRVALFREAIGEDPDDCDSDHRQVVPPTLIGLGLDPAPFDFVDLFGRNLGNLLHTNQSVRYLRPIYVGEQLQGTKRVVEIFDKKGGALEFLVLEIEYRNHSQELIGVSRQTLVFVQSPAPT